MLADLCYASICALGLDKEQNLKLIDELIGTPLAAC